MRLKFKNSGFLHATIQYYLFFVSLEISQYFIVKLILLFFVNMFKIQFV